MEAKSTFKSKIFDILYKGHQSLKNNSDLIIVEYYDKHRDEFKHSRQAFFDLLNEQLELVKAEVARKLEKRPHEKNVWLLYWTVTPERLLSIGQHLKRLGKLWFEEKPDETQRESKINYRGFVLLHYHWGKYDKTKTITDTNAADWAGKHKLKSKGQLLRQWKSLIDDNGNLSIGNNHIARKETKTQYEFIIPMLESLCPEAVNDAKRKYESLK